MSSPDFTRAAQIAGAVRLNDVAPITTRWLEEFLAQGPRGTSEVQRAANAHGICPRTLRRAFRDLDGEAVKQPPFAFGQWVWKLPAKDGQNPGGEFWPSLGFPNEFFNYKYAAGPAESPTPVP
jgi:hypothetical protein